MYTSEAISGVEEVLALVLVSVTRAMNERLIAPFDDGEVKSVLFQMFLLKAPGRIDILLNFFKSTGICVELK
jgi:hypothetical protein